MSEVKHSPLSDEEKVTVVGPLVIPAEFCQMVKDVQEGRERQERERLEEMVKELIDQKRVMIAALDAVLLFHSGSPWTVRQRLRWVNLITIVLGPAIQRDCKVVGANGDGTWDGALPTNEATTKNLCNAVRAALKKAGCL